MGKWFKKSGNSGIEFLWELGFRGAHDTNFGRWEVGVKIGWEVGGWVKIFWEVGGWGLKWEVGGRVHNLKNNNKE